MAWAWRAHVMCGAEGRARGPRSQSRGIVAGDPGQGGADRAGHRAARAVVVMEQPWERGPLARPFAPYRPGQHAYSTWGRAAGRPRSWNLRHCSLSQPTSLVWALPIILHHSRCRPHSADVPSAPTLRPSRRSTTGTGRRPALPGPSHHHNCSCCSAPSSIRAAFSWIAGQDATRAL